MTAGISPPTGPGTGLPRAWSPPGNALRLASFPLVVLAVCWAHSPALNRFFVADQISYFAELDGDRSLAKGLSFWDYNATRRFAKGDQLLFRPLLFAVLAIENSLFGTDPIGWNLVNLLLHAATACMLLQFLWHLHPGPAATLFALFFAVNHSLVELVVWNHLGGYLLAALLILVTLYCVVRCTEQLEPRRQTFWAGMFAASGLLAALSYELGVAMALLGAAAIWVYTPCHDGRRNRVALGLATIPTLGYAIGYAAHLANVSRLTWRQQDGPPRTALSVILQCCRCSGVWLLEAIDPWRSILTPASPFDRFVRLPARADALTVNLTTAVILLTCATLLMLNGLAVRSFLRSRAQGACVLGLLVFYLLITNVGRDYAERTTYYSYFFCLLLVLLVAASLDVGSARAWAARAGALLLLGLCAVNVVFSRSTSAALHLQHVPINGYFDKLRAVIETHDDEPGFTFIADGVPNSLDPPRLLIHGFPDDPQNVEVRRVSGLIFPNWYSPQPKYYLHLTSAGLEAVLADAGQP